MWIDRFVIDDCPPSLMGRAYRAIRPGWLFLWNGQFYEVQCVDFVGKRIDIARRARQSIDDCSPAEWSAAAKQTR
jgi:hypothetical protein